MRKRSWLLLLALALVVGVTGTGGFSAAEADRNVAVAVTDDENAYVGYDAPEDVSLNTTAEDETALLTVTNRLHTPIEITNVNVEPASANVTVEKPTGEFDPGDEKTVSLTDCEEDTGETVYVTIEVEGTDVSVTLSGTTRPIEIECHS